MDDLKDRFAEVMAESLSDLEGSRLSGKTRMTMHRHILDAADDIGFLKDVVKETAPGELLGRRSLLLACDVYLEGGLEEIREMDSEERAEALWNACEACGGAGRYVGLNEIEDPCTSCSGEGFALDWTPSPEGGSTPLEEMVRLRQAHKNLTFGERYGTCGASELEGRVSDDTDHDSGMFEINLG